VEPPYPLPPLPTLDARVGAKADAAAATAWADTYVAPLLPDRPTVYILRGISGSGKSSVCSRLAAGAPPGMAAVVASADDYFVVRGGGTYAFDVSLLAAAHAACRTTFEDALAAGAPVVIVDNTNTTVSEYANYEEAVADVNDSIRRGVVPPPVWPDAAAVGRDTGRGADGYDLVIVAITVRDVDELAYLATRNRHGVPWDVLLRQFRRFQHDDRAAELPPFIPPSAAPLAAALRARRTAAAAPHATPASVDAAMRAAVAAAVAATGLPFAPPPPPPVAPAAAASVTPATSSSTVAALAAALAGASRIASIHGGSGGGSGGGGVGGGGGGGGGGEWETPQPIGAAHRRSDRGVAASSPAAGSGALLSMPLLPPGEAAAKGGGEEWDASVLRLFAKRVAYIGLFLDDRSVSRLCVAHKLKYGESHCDHVTVAFSPAARDVTAGVLEAMGLRASLVALREASGLPGVQAVTVAWSHECATCSVAPPSRSSRRAASPGGRGRGGRGAAPPRDDTCTVRRGLAELCPDNGMSWNAIPHITMSCAPGVPPVSSNALLERLAAEGGGASASSASSASPLYLTVYLGCAVHDGGGIRILSSQRSLHTFLAMLERRGGRR